MIPKIIHQTWKTKDIPYKIYNKKWVDSWKKYNPDWEYRFWTDEDLRNFIKDKFPWFLDIYDSYPYDICRVDAARYFILYEYGGLYVDLDFECLKNFDDLLENDAVLGSLMKNKDLELRDSAHIPNALMMSAPNHHFWEFIFLNLKKSSNVFKDRMGDKKQFPRNINDIILIGYLTGSDVLYYTYMYYKIVSKSYPSVYEKVTLFPYWYFYPFNFDHFKSDEWKVCEEDLKDSYAITYWTGVWIQKKE